MFDDWFELIKSILTKFNLDALHKSLGRTFHRPKSKMADERTDIYQFYSPLNFTILNSEFNKSENMYQVWLLTKHWYINLNTIQYGCKKSKMATVKIWTLITWSTFVIERFSGCQILGLNSRDTESICAL